MEMLAIQLVSFCQLPPTLAVSEASYRCSYIFNDAVPSISMAFVNVNAKSGKAFTAATTNPSFA